MSTAAALAQHDVGQGWLHRRVPQCFGFANLQARGHRRGLALQGGQIDREQQWKERPGLYLVHEVEACRGERDDLVRALGRQRANQAGRCRCDGLDTVAPEAGRHLLLEPPGCELVVAAAVADNLAPRLR